MRQPHPDPDIERYRNGKCLDMAHAMHQLTGLPMKLIDYGMFCHAFVQAGNGDIIDIHGRMARDAFLAMVVEAGGLPRWAVEQGKVVIEDLTPERQAKLVRGGFRSGPRQPSPTSITQACRVARRHPNLAHWVRHDWAAEAMAANQASEPAGNRRADAHHDLADLAAPAP